MRLKMLMITLEETDRQAQQMRKDKMTIWVDADSLLGEAVSRGLVQRQLASEMAPFRLDGGYIRALAIMQCNADACV
jgi:hypothetical protein